MKNFIAYSIILVFFFSCKERKTTLESEAIADEGEKIEKNLYPKALQNVFEAHGGLPLWKKQRTLAYRIPKPENPEVHTIDLYSRKDRIETPNHDMGYDGNAPWVLNKTGEYKGNVEFYHNLMFYFYAMPFVLADDGIHYDITSPLVFEEKSYPGIKISYGSGVGTSPKDEYYIHYDPKTFRMQWLGYTVTYGTDKKTDNVNWICYDDWGEYSGLKLPNSISWYHHEGRDIMELRNTVKFERVSVSMQSQPHGFYEKPGEAKFYSKPE